MPSKVDPNSLTQTKVLECGGNALSTVVTNGSGKSEFKIEETAVEEDSRVPRSVSEVKNVELFQILEMANGLKSNVPSQ
jgi:hypothetical protein